MSEEVQAISDNALRIEWSGDVTLQLNETISRFCSTLQVYSIPGVVEWVPAYKSVTIYYLPHQITHEALLKKVQSILKIDESKIKHNKKKRTVSVPVYYGEEVGPDLERIADMNNITPGEVVRRHQQSLYFIYMLGFLPGFPYLGGLDQSIATPRHETVRKVTPKGSVGIAHHQTGIYPTTSPGGWNIIGKTPLPLMDLSKQNPFLFQAGDYVRFIGIEKGEFLEIKQKVDRQKYDMSRHIEHD